jgi:hypothetical protein
MGAPLIDVQARWAYSEIIDAALSHCYDQSAPGIAALSTKRADGVPFDQLSKEERAILAAQNQRVRGTLLRSYLVGINLFDIVEIDKEGLATIIIPRIVWEGYFVPFAQYIKTQKENLDDARNVSLKEEYKAPIDPVIFGWHEGYPAVLIDGLHRAARLWKYGPADGKLLAYTPHRFDNSF